MMMQVMYCSTSRSGELLGLQWTNVHIFGEDAEHPYIYIDRELARFNKDSIESTDTVVYLTFPMISPNQTTQLVLKKPRPQVVSGKYISRSHWLKSCGNTRERKMNCSLGATFHAMIWSFVTITADRSAMIPC